MGEQQDLELLRQRVRASRRATSAPMLIFGGTMLVFAAYDGTVNYAFVPLPLFWPLCSLVALLVLAGVDRVRRGRTGVGAGLLPYAKAAAILAAILLAGNVVWLFPFTKLLLYPTTVLTVLALRQRNRPLAARSGAIGIMMIAGWFLDGPVPGSWFDTFVMGVGGLTLTLLGLVARRRERIIE